MAFVLAESGQLRAGRGDVILFANTDALGLEAGRLARIRAALSREPSVTGRRHEAG